MANGILVLAAQGSGKSTSILRTSKEDLKSEADIEGLNPAETFLINIKGKPLPHRGWKRGFNPMEVDTINQMDRNYFNTADAESINIALKFFDQYRTDIHNVVIDDFQYLMAEEFVANALKTGYEKFSKMAKHAYDVLNTGLKMRNDVNFIVLSHSEKDGESHKMKTIGKMLDEKVTLEGLFTIVLYMKTIFDPSTKKVQKVFVTNYDGEFPAKTPIGMFDKLYIPNDLGLVVRKVNEYYNG